MTRDTMRNSMLMHVSKSHDLPRRTCASASLRLSGDFDRITVAVFPRPFRIDTSGAAFAIEAGENVFDHVPRKQPIDRRPPRRDRPLRYGLVESGQDRIDGDSAREAFEQLREPLRSNPMGRN